MSDYWFGKKRIGYGYRPANAMGWLITLLFVVVLVGDAFVFLENDTPNLAAFIGVLVADLVVLCGVVVVKRER
jgi:hypothetical protein